MKNKILQRHLVFAALCFVVLVASYVSSVLITVYRVVERSELWQILILLVAISSSIGLVEFLKLFFTTKRFFASLELENSYTLGHKTTFYNFEAFKTRVVALSKKRLLRSKRLFIIAFSCTNLKISTNTFNNEMITALNYNVSLYLEDLFSKKGQYSSKDNVYGFNRGVFLLCLFTSDERKIPDIINTISQNVYRISSEKNLKVYVQPFYGIREVIEGENITGAIEDAFLTRNVSESNFELYSFFNPSYKKESTRDDIFEIEAALRNHEFVIYYQPKYSLKEKKFISSEALARWNSPKHGLLTPQMFISKAESAGLISLIDNYIFELAVKTISEQLKRGRRAIPVSINFSIYEFYASGFLDNVIYLLDKYNVPAKYIEIEITETTSQANQFISISIIKKLKELGIRVLMDDFGVGYSGIDNLRKIPFDAIKIDKSFSDLLVEDEKTRAIVKLLTELGHTSNIEVIIEGVDNEKQVEILKKMHIDTIQGYYYSKPIPLDAYEAFLKDNRFERKEKNK